MNKTKSVLLVDDDEDLRSSIAMLLEHHGLKVLEASNGAEALALIAQAMPAVIILDMKMPVMDGWKFAEHFRTMYGSPVPIVVSTAAANARQHAESIGAGYWLDKPFKMDRLVSMITTLVSGGEGQIT